MYRQYAINLRDGRVVLCTRETLANIDYYAISEKVAFAIENGVIDRKEVISKVKGKLLTSQEEWDALLTKKTTQNVRHSEIKPEDAEKSETKIEKEDVSSEFDMDIPGSDGGEPAPKPVKGGKGKGGKKSEQKTEDNQPEETSEGEGDAAANGGVNV